jgi:hypothetical protein
MRAALPHHATNEFVRLVQALRLERTPFEFLAPMQASGAALPRSALVRRALVDRALLRFLLEAAGELAAPRVAARGAMPFYAALLVEALSAAEAIDEDLVAALLPHLLAGLRPDALPEYRAATMMGLATLAGRAALGAELLDGAWWGGWRRAAVGSAFLSGAGDDHLLATPLARSGRSWAVLF